MKIFKMKYKCNNHIQLGFCTDLDLAYQLVNFWNLTSEYKYVLIDVNQIKNYDFCDLLDYGYEAVNTGLHNQDNIYINNITE